MFGRLLLEKLGDRGHMSDRNRTREELISELRHLRRRIASLEGSMPKDRTGETLAEDVKTKAVGEGGLVVDSEAFRRMFKDHGAVMYIVDLSTFAIIDANKAALSFYGYDLETMLTKRVPDLNITPEAEIRAEIKRAVEEGRAHYVFKHQLASGEIRDIEVYANPITIQGKEYSFSVVHDITARRLAEESLKESERRLRESQRISRVGSYTYDIAADRWVSSEVLDEIFGIDDGYEKSAAGWATIVHPKDREEMSAYLRRVLDEEIPFDREYRIVRIADGTVHWLHGRGELTRDATGRPVTLLGPVQDVTERKKSEEERERLITELQTALEEVKTLRGIIPICSFCKKIRDDQGFWSQVEGYVEEHSEAIFSHSLCPECLREHYPDYID